MLALAESNPAEGSSDLPVRGHNAIAEDLVDLVPFAVAADMPAPAAEQEALPPVVPACVPFRERGCEALFRGECLSDLVRRMNEEYAGPNGELPETLPVYLPEPEDPSKLSDEVVRARLQIRERIVELYLGDIASFSDTHGSSFLLRPNELVFPKIGAVRHLFSTDDVAGLVNAIYRFLDPQDTEFNRMVVDREYGIIRFLSGNVDFMRLCVETAALRAAQTARPSRGEANNDCPAERSVGGATSQGRNGCGASAKTPEADLKGVANLVNMYSSDVVFRISREDGIQFKVSDLPWGRDVETEIAGKQVKLNGASRENILKSRAGIARCARFEFENRETLLPMLKTMFFNPELAEALPAAMESAMERCNVGPQARISWMNLLLKKIIEVWPAFPEGFWMLSESLHEQWQDWYSVWMVAINEISSAKSSDELCKFLNRFTKEILAEAADDLVEVLKRFNREKLPLPVREWLDRMSPEKPKVVVVEQPAATDEDPEPPTIMARDICLVCPAAGKFK